MKNTKQITVKNFWLVVLFMVSVIAAPAQNNAQPDEKLKKEFQNPPLESRPKGKHGVQPVVKEEMILNIDIGPTILELAGTLPLSSMHGLSFAKLIKQQYANRKQSCLD